MWWVSFAFFYHCTALFVSQALHRRLQAFNVSEVGRWMFKTDGLTSSIFARYVRKLYMMASTRRNAPHKVRRVHEIRISPVCFLSLRSCVKKGVPGMHHLSSCAPCSSTFTGKASAVWFAQSARKSVLPFSPHATLHSRKARFRSFGRRCAIFTSS